MKLACLCCFFKKTTAIEPFDNIHPTESNNGFDRENHIKKCDARRLSADNINKSKKLTRMFTAYDREEIRQQEVCLRYRYDLPEELILPGTSLESKI